ncbi:hypothetical protein DOO78_18565 [Roseicella frigidaeris]|uniref:HpcH/HpaI aldolase/citrate lyase domain-containing protein n=2 Tax=Roseicella frigidaeris TaxID=2230885 RepID=A0A327M4B7_9PROT|nr:hypothetical protein DOO78_18565 [Roseicella frigidaeris]
MMKKSLKQMVRSGELAAGTFLVEFVTPGIGHILAGAGCDFAFLDMEHSGFSEETVKAGLRFLEAGGIPTLVRIPSREAHDVARIADIGAEGVMLPLVGSLEVARAAVAALKYPPLGRRGVALRIAHDNYRAAPAAEALATANERTVLILMIETAEGVEQAGAIAALEGVDALWVGHFDLSASLGIPGEFEHPRFREATRRICAAAKAHGKGLGRLVTGEPEARQAVADGFRLIAWGGDAWLLQEAVAAGVGVVKGMRVADGHDRAEEQHAAGRIPSPTSIPVSEKKEEVHRRQVTGAKLNEKWRVGAAHALYRETGDFYMLLERFPGALFDTNGYVFFATEDEYLNCPHLIRGARLNVRGGIASIPGYIRVKP